MVGEKVLTVCRNHSDCIIYHNVDLPCPYCDCLKVVKEMQEEYEVLEDKYNTATSGAKGSL